MALADASSYSSVVGRSRRMRWKRLRVGVTRSHFNLEFRFEGGLPFQEMPRRTPARGKIMDAMTFPRSNRRPQRGTTSVRYGTVMVVPSPVVVMENVPAVLDV